jgi:hypothetical protein
MFPWKLDCDLDTLAGRLRSSSSTPRAGERYESMLGELAAIHSRFARAGGLVSVAYYTSVSLSEKP